MKLTKFTPILFRTPMVQAILEGRKTQTRRVIKSKHKSGLFAVGKNKAGQVTEITSLDWDERSVNVTNDIGCKYSIWDILWVKETYYAYGRWVKNGLTKTGKQKYKFTDLTLTSNSDLEYKYEDCKPQRIKTGRTNEIGWYKRPSLFMPKAACRIFLKITNLRVERSQDISEEDAVAESANPCLDELSMDNRVHNYNNPSTARFPLVHVTGFKSLWQSINGEESWNDNPWVWCINFERINKPENLN